MKMKTIAKILFIFAFGIVCSTTTIFLHKKFSPNYPTPITTTIVAKNEIQKDVVISKLQTNAQIVGLEGKFSKEYIYKDANFWGSREFTLNVSGTFKMGFNVKDLINNISIDGDTIKILSPKITLISFEAPYHEAKLDSDIDLFRRSFSDGDIQEFYKSAVTKARTELFNNKIEKEARIKTEEVVRSLLMTIPNVKEIVWCDLSSLIK